MDLNIRNHNGVKIVDMAGDLDSVGSSDVYQDIQAHLSGGDRVVLNLQSVPYMSSAGIRALLLVYRAVLNSGGKIVLVGLSEELQETLDITGFLEYFNMKDNIDAGIQAVS